MHFKWLQTQRFCIDQFGENEFVGGMTLAIVDIDEITILGGAHFCHQISMLLNQHRFDE